jgi:hypothetical protein
MEASRAEPRGGYIHLSRLSRWELTGMLSAGILFLSLNLPWFSTSETNQNSVIESAGKSGGDSATAWETFAILDYLLVAACTAPFVLAWIIARGHTLTWRPGEVTMIVGITAFVLILCNGIILGKPDNGVEISFAYGYLVALLACIGIMISGFLRQAVGERGRKPPGTL